MKKIANYLILIVLISTILSCGNYKYLYGYTNDDYYKRVSKSLEYVIEKDKLFLVFTKNYNDSKVKIIQNEIVIFNSNISTKENGIAEVIKVKINSEINIFLDKSKRPLKITSEQMKLYKNIYVEKNKKEVIVEFNNGQKI